jgi:hypothetical protein
MYTLKAMSKRLAIHANKLGYEMSASDIELLLNTLKWKLDGGKYDVDKTKINHCMGMNWLFPVWYSSCKDKDGSYAQLWTINELRLNRIYIGVGKQVQQLLMELWQEEKRLYRNDRVKELQSQWSEQASV